MEAPACGGAPRGATMRAATARTLAPASGHDPRFGRRRAAASSRPWSSVPTLHGSSSSSSGTPRVCARRWSRSRSVVSATSTTPTASTREGESGDARGDVPGAPAASPTRGADADASASNRDGDDRSLERPSLTPGQRRAAEKKAIHAKRHPNGHAKDVSLHLRAKAKARRGDKQGALEELRRGVARFPKNAHIGVSFARALADDFDAADAHGEARALENALKHLDALEEATKEDKEDAMAVNSTSASVMYQLRGVLEARRLELFASSEASDPGSRADKKTAPSARRVRAAFEASVALDPEHWAAWHAWGIFEMRRGRANKARRLLREARRSDPRRARTLQTLAALEASFLLNAIGGTRSNAAALASARSLFAEAIALDATHAPSYTAWATMEARAGNLTRAARVFREGEEATRDAARDVARFDYSFFREKNFLPRREVRDDDDDDLRKIDRDGDPLFSRSALLAAYGAFEAKRAPGSSKTRSHARTLFREACDLCRLNPRAFAAWAAAEMAFQKHDATRVSGMNVSLSSQEQTTTTSPALRVLEEALRTHPGNERLLHARASAFRLAGDADRAVARLESLLRSSDRFARNPKTWHALGSALRDAGRFDDAVDAFERGAFCESQKNDDDRRVNLPCLTSAAAEAARGGDAARARRLFARGSALASPRADALRPFDAVSSAFETADGASIGGFTPLASVDGDGRERYTTREGSRDGAVNERRSFKKNADGETFWCAPTDFERCAHLRLWAAFEKRDGRNTTARALFARASAANPADALVWLQWGQFERRVEGIETARARFKTGVARVSRPTKSRAFLYQAWADLEVAAFDLKAARDVYERATAAHPASPELFLAFGAFLEDHREALAEDETTTTSKASFCFARAAELAAGTAFFRTVRDVRRAYGHLEEARGAEEREPLSFDGSDENARGLGMAEW